MNKLSIKISIRIILLFSAAILMTFIPETFRDFFGDWMCEGSGTYVDNYGYTGCNYDGRHDAEWHWGWRHYLWALMSLCLAVVQIADIVLTIEANDK